MGAVGFYRGVSGQWSIKLHFNFNFSRYLESRIVSLYSCCVCEPCIRIGQRMHVGGGGLGVGCRWWTYFIQVTNIAELYEPMHENVKSTDLLLPPSLSRLY